MTREASLFGSLLRRYRLAAGLSQERLAARAGISTDAVATLEQGKRRSPHAATVKRPTDALALGEAERAELLAAARPVPVQAVTSGGRADTQATPQTLLHLAARPTPLVGRADELETLLRRLTVEARATADADRPARRGQDAPGFGARCRACRRSVRSRPPFS
jgi:transcriptional regulator with XRE-family HTH domain